MAAKSRSNKAASAPDARGRMTRWLVQCVALVLLVAAFLGGVIWLGRWGQGQIHDHERYLVPVAAIACEPPPGLDRAEFLDQVRYAARLPAQLNVLDEELPGQLRAAFARHPWVAKVDDVTLRPPKQIEVRLTYRAPVLAVPWDGELRAVDAAGVLLPKNAPTRGLPVYEGQPRPPRGPAGSRWGDPNVEQQARQLAAR